MVYLDLRTLQEVKWRQLDIILHLANRGVPLTETDDKGLTASHLACRRMDVGERFIEAAMLLGEIEMGGACHSLGPFSMSQAYHYIISLNNAN